MAFLPYKGAKCACSAQFPRRVWKLCHFAYNLAGHPQFLFRSIKYWHAEEGSGDLGPLYYVKL